MPKDELDGLPVIDTDEQITVAVKPEDIQEGDRPTPNSTQSPLPCGGSAALMMRVSPKERY